MTATIRPSRSADTACRSGDASHGADQLLAVQAAVAVEVEAAQVFIHQLQAVIAAAHLVGVVGVDG